MCFGVVKLFHWRVSRVYCFTDPLPFTVEYCCIPQEYDGCFIVNMLAALGLNLMEKGFHLTVVQLLEQTVRDPIIVNPGHFPNKSGQHLQRA